MDPQEFLPSNLELEECDPQLEATAELEDAAIYLDLESWILNKLRHCERELAVNLPIIRDDDLPVTLSGLRIQHFCSRGPTLGRIGISPSAHISTLRAEAMHATWQAALLRLPFGGAAGALVCNPGELSERELRQLAKDYAYALRGFVGQETDVLAPGANCNAQVMAWMLDSNARPQDRLELGAITGKPKALWGLPDFDSITAQGLRIALEHLLAERNANLSGKRISIQGFGSLGSSIAAELAEQGALIVAVADLSGGIRNAVGINFSALRNHVKQERFVLGFAGAEAVCNADVLEADCDILIMAAAERQINAANASRVCAPIVVEVAPRAITPKAGVELEHRNITIVPELVASFGTAIASFIEWNQSSRAGIVKPTDISQELDPRIANAMDVILALAQRAQVSFRRAVYIEAVNLVANELRLRN